MIGQSVHLGLTILCFDLKLYQAPSAIDGMASIYAEPERVTVCIGGADAPDIRVVSYAWRHLGANSRVVFVSTEPEIRFAWIDESTMVLISGLLG